MNKGKVKQHYKKVLTDEQRRRKHFKASGALGDAPSDDYKKRLYEIEMNNRVARGRVLDNLSEATDKKMDELKKKGKITIGSV